MKHLTIADLLEPITNTGFVIHMTGDSVPTFVVKKNNKQAEFRIGLDKVNISEGKPTVDNTIHYWTEVVKELQKQVNIYDWESE